MTFLLLARVWAGLGFNGWSQDSQRRALGEFSLKQFQHLTLAFSTKSHQNDRCERPKTMADTLEEPGPLAGNGRAWKKMQSTI